MTATLPSLVAELAARTPDAPALVAGERRLSFGELDEAARRAATVLADAGESVGLLAPNRADWLVVALGAMRAGARVDAFNTWSKAWDLEHLLAASGCRVLVTVERARSTDTLGELRRLVPEVLDGGRSERFPALERVIVLGEQWDGLLAAAGPTEADHSTPDDVAFVLYTSGSTSRPKAVPLCQGDMLANGASIGDRMGLSAADRVWLGSPLFWSFGSANALPATWTHGACLVVQEHFAPEEAAALLAAEHCTAAYLLPTMVEALIPQAGRVRAVTSLRTGLTIGRPEEVERAVRELDVPELCNVYGSTEVYGNCCVTPHDAPLELRLVSQGPPLDGVEVRAVDPDGRVLPTGEAGELQVRGHVMPGYLGAPGATAAVMTADGWFRTGDRLLVRDDGYVEFGARLTDMIKTSGINVAPAEVESYLAGHPAVAEVAVVGAPHPSRGEVVIAFVTVTEGVDGVDGETLQAWCREGIAGYKVPFRVVVLPELPRTVTGKLTRSTLVELAVEEAR
jgi:fatty-acyl-CoA synthase